MCIFGPGEQSVTNKSYMPKPSQVYGIHWDRIITEGILQVAETKPNKTRGRGAQNIHSLWDKKPLELLDQGLLQLPSIFTSCCTIDLAERSGAITGLTC